MRFTAACSTDRTVDFGSVLPVGPWATEVLFFYLATVFGFIPYRLASALRLS